MPQTKIRLSGYHTLQQPRDWFGKPRQIRQRGTERLRAYRPYRPLVISGPMTDLSTFTIAVFGLCLIACCGRVIAVQGS